MSYNEHREDRLAYQKKYNRSNVDEIKEYQKQYFLLHKEELMARRKEKQQAASHARKIQKEQAKLEQKVLAQFMKEQRRFAREEKKRIATEEAATVHVYVHEVAPAVIVHKEYKMRNGLYLVEF